MLGARVRDITSFSQIRPRLMMGGGIGQSDAGRVIVVFERALRIALLLTSVVGERGVRLAFLPLPAVAVRLIEAKYLSLRRPKLIMRVQALAPNLLASL
jgi:hypothetical protein